MHHIQTNNHTAMDIIESGNRMKDRRNIASSECKNYTRDSIKDLFLILLLLYINLELLYSYLNNAFFHK